MYEVRSLGIGDRFLQVLSEFLKKKTVCDAVDGCYRSSNPVTSGVPQGSVL